MRVSRRRLEFRLVLAVLLVWSAWPTVAGALDASTPPPTAAATASTTTAVPNASTTSTTVDASPPSTADVPPPAPPPAPPTDPPPSAPADTVAPEPSPTTAPSSPSANASPAAITTPGVEEFGLPAYCDGTGGDLVTVTNRDRAANGLAPVCPNARLEQVAQQWADHLAATATFVHQDLWSAVDTTPFYAMAENILRAPGPITIDQMEVLWMDSPEHRVNIVNPLYVAVGVGIARDAKGVTYAVVEFGGMPR